MMNSTFQVEQSPNLRLNEPAEEPAEKPADYEYYDEQPGRRYMQSMRRGWNNNRGIRSEDDYGEDL
jgi:hypothetical protein